jgi:anthranilate phosphoribosyltransferase
VPLVDGAERARRALDTGFAFLFAPAFHPAMRAVVPVRRTLGVRTVFNLLGPLCNPARPRYQLLGAFSEPAAALLARASVGLGGERVWVVHGEPGWDEATPCGPFVLFRVEGGTVRREVRDPLDAGIPRCVPEDLAGGDASHNAERLERLLLGRDTGPHADAVALNVGLVLELSGRVADLGEGVGQARDALTDGRTADLLARLRAQEAA